jgi:hypothetical protein
MVQTIETKSQLLSELQEIQDTKTIFINAHFITLMVKNKPRIPAEIPKP